MRHDDEAREDAEETRMYEREQEAREEGKWPLPGYDLLARRERGSPVITVEIQEHAPPPILGTARGQIRVSPDFNAPMVLDADENGDPRGSLLCGSAPPLQEAEPAGSLFDHEQAAPDDHDIALVQHAIDPPAGPLLPRAQFLFAAAARMTSAIRINSVEPKLSHLTLALGAANLVAIYLPTLVRGLEEEVEKRASTFPRECSCGRVISREQWAAMPLVGVHRDDAVELEMKHCECRSTLAMPVGA